MLIHCGASKAQWLPSFSENVFVQYLGEPTSTLGRYKPNPTSVVPYTENIREMMNEMNLDPEAGVYFAERDELYDLPDYQPKEGVRRKA